MAMKGFWNPRTSRKPAYCYVPDSAKLPTLGATAEDADPVARVKLFDPTGSWTWYLTEFDPGTGEAFGLVDGSERELGPIDLKELAAFTGRFGLPIERDLSFTPTKLSALPARA